MEKGLNIRALDMNFDIDDAILEYFEENDWEMNMESIEFCANKLQNHFKSQEEAIEYVQGYLNSMFEN
jgi:hypothetical protein